MAARPQILIVGDDLRLLQTREMILGARFDVHISARRSEALNLVRDHSFELVVVCRATESWRDFVEFVIGQKPAPKALAVTSSENEFPSWADRVISSNKGPYELLKACSEMFGMITKSKSNRYPTRASKTPLPIS